MLHASKPSLFLVVEGGFLRQLLPKLAFEDPYETEMCVGWAAHAIELWLSKLYLQGGKNNEASKFQCLAGGDKFDLTGQRALNFPRSGTGLPGD
jgi:hypothetical protein